MSGSKHHLRSGKGAALGAHRCHRELKRSVSICCSYVGGNMTAQELVLCCCEVHFCAVVGPFAQLLMLRED